MKTAQVLFLLTSFTLYACKESKTSQLPKGIEHQSCDSCKASAALDFKKHSLKYYYTGIANAPAPLVTYLNKELKIQIVNKGCVLSPKLSCYNAYTEALIVEKTGKSLDALMKQLK